MELAYLSLGSNMGDRAGNLRRAIASLGDVSEIVRVSSFYETEPVEIVNQDLFINCVAALRTGLSAEQLLAGLLTIERKMGRIRTGSKGPRLIDLDILLFGDKIRKGESLTIPHPAMHARRFVLEPMAEIAPELKHPILGRSMAELLADLPAGTQAVNKITEPLRE